MKRWIAVLGLLAALLVGTALAPAASPVRAAAPAAPAATTAAHPAAVLDKTRFLADMGLGAYAFYHFVYAKFLNGAFTSGTLASLAPVYAKAAIALLFAYNRFNAAYKIASTSKSKTLQLLAAPLKKLKAHFDQEHTNLQHGHYSNNDMVALNNEYNNYSNITHANGYTITQIPSYIPGVSK